MSFEEEGLGRCHEAANLTLEGPFSGTGSIPAMPGRTVCQECKTQFEIDDREECAFVDPLLPRLPIDETFCPACRLVQDGETENCFLCRAPLNRKTH